MVEHVAGVLVWCGALVLLTLDVDHKEAVAGVFPVGDVPEEDRPGSTSSKGCGHCISTLAHKEMRAQYQLVPPRRRRIVHVRFDLLVVVVDVELVALPLLVEDLKKGLLAVD